MEEIQTEMGMKRQGVMESGSLRSDIFYDILERSNEINKYCDMLKKESYSKRVMLLGEIITDNSKPEEKNEKNANPSWVNSIYIAQSMTINKLLEIKEIIESI